jgi:hypothetical protein
MNQSKSMLYVSEYSFDIRSPRLNYGVEKIANCNVIAEDLGLDAVYFALLFTNLLF